MMRLLCSIVFFLCGVAFAEIKPVPSGPVRVYTGPDGEKIGLVEVEKSTKILVHYQDIGGGMERQTRLYNLEDLGNGDRAATYQTKRGSKMIAHYVLQFKRGHWTFFHPEKENTEFKIEYSKQESEKLKLEDVLTAFKP